jgi:3-deoxy-manno-octulosonate cytidylyltransferase (CMP-KDO synthetase)
MENIICCIPARYASTRLPGKPLLKFGEKTIINHVYDRCKKMNVCDIIVLTDDDRIYNEVIKFGGKCVIINEDCLNGTERIIKYLNKYNIKCDIVVNVQGDEPFIEPENVNRAINNYLLVKEKNKNMVCSTIYYETIEEKEIKSKNRGKLVCNKESYIMYCSRNIIPSCKNHNIIPDHKYKIHIGVFVYDCNYLRKNFLKENTELQLCEDIEWMKILEQGYNIISDKVQCTEISVDTIDDYTLLLSKYK